MKLASRKPHRKTRTGCSTCKRRKIKCDEQRPACTNCRKHSVQCDYLLLTTSTGGSPTSTPPIPAQSGTSLLPLAIGPLRQSPLPQNPLPLNLRDLELLHHYTTSTCLTLSSDPSLKALWRINVPQIGFRADYVMHTILSISALHLAHYLPEKREYYAAQGKAHHQSGLRMATSLLANVTNDNCDSIYIFSTMTLFITLATSRTSEDFLLLRNETNGGWLELLKGTYFIIRNYEHSLINSSLSAMFVAGRKRENLREEASLEYSAETDDLQELRYHISESQLEPHTYSLFWDLLDEQHRLWIRWPIEEIGWVPDPDRAAAKIDPSLISNPIQVQQGPQAQPMDKMYQEHSPHSSVYDHSPQPNNYMSPPGPTT
ncbi:hypothetical protein HYALB_00005739 [Hymenoscyphus albidus]|uniref:Zn(2)-C6 fungal-type domain-containing protein n=1 Tax=Hymenoscyphus albidus TaxID=595503 RepID=A0A9N9LNI2_9HELO|nr:hypothetical protein HYALB_00005739 [Hymenoscyphus albidus]